MLYFTVDYINIFLKNTEIFMTRTEQLQPVVKHHYPLNPNSMLSGLKPAITGGDVVGSGLGNTKALIPRRSVLVSGVLLTLFAVTGCSEKEKDTGVGPLEFTAALEDAIGKEGIEIVRTAYSDYFNVYGPPIVDTITFGVSNYDELLEENADGGTTRVLEQAGPGYINYDIGAIKQGVTDQEYLLQLILD